MGEAKDIFKYGLSLTDVNGDLVSTATLLERAADVVSGLTNETDKAAISMRLFGESGRAPIPLEHRGPRRPRYASERQGPRYGLVQRGHA